jgi:protein TonB
LSAVILTAPRPPFLRRERSRLDRILLLSLLAHALLVAVIVEAKFLSGHHAPEMSQPGFEMVFGNAPDTAQASPDTATPPPSAPQVNLSPQEYDESPPPLMPSPEAMPMPRPPPPRPRHAPSANPFANMPIYGLAQNPSPRPQIRRSRGLNLAMDSVAQGGMTAEANPDISAPGADGSFLSELNDYVQRHKYYPDLAARNGESGNSIIKAIFNHDGTVQSVQLLKSSGSRTLDVAWMDLFRHKKVAPFPASMPQTTQEVILSMDYQLIQQ